MKNYMTNLLLWNHATVFILKMAQVLCAKLFWNKKSLNGNYRQFLNIRRTLGNKTVDHSDVVG